jgi:hypothetical protein
MLLKELDSSDTDVGQHQGEPVASAGPSTNVKGFTELPKNVMLIKDTIGRLTDKVFPGGKSDLSDFTDLLRIFPRVLRSDGFRWPRQRLNRFKRKR